MQWKTISTNWVTGERLLLGSIEIGRVSYDVTVSKSDSGRYAATCSLPGIKKEKTHFQSLEKAKEAVEQVVTEWLKRAGLQEAAPTVWCTFCGRRQPEGGNDEISKG